MTLSDMQDRFLKIEPGLRLVVEIALVIAIGAMLARMIWFAVAPKASVATYNERPLPTMQAAASERIEADLSLLVRTNPFEGAGSVTEIVQDAPDTQLNLKLIGLRADTGPNAGTATIILPSNQQQKFSEGDDVLPGVELKRVLSDRVILNRNGIDEILRLNNRSGRFSVIGDGSVSAESTNVAPAPVRIPLSDPTVLLSVVSLSEARANGRVLGYRLEARGGIDRFQSLGFQPGDVLLSVNGSSVANQDPSELIEQIGSSREAVLNIDRGGNPVEVIFELQE
ncbi:MAG: type II secretion system protein N [Pseudomonadota bacterium]